MKHMQRKGIKMVNMMKNVLKSPASRRLAEDELHVYECVF